MAERLYCPDAVVLAEVAARLIPESEAHEIMEYALAGPEMAKFLEVPSVQWISRAAGLLAAAELYLGHSNEYGHAEEWPK